MGLEGYVCYSSYFAFLEKNTLKSGVLLICGLRVAGCGVQVYRCGLRVYRLQAAGLQVAGCRFTGCRLQFVGCTGCGLQVYRMLMSRLWNVGLGYLQVVDCI